jgi:flagellar secretion chaperone FliS
MTKTMTANAFASRGYRENSVLTATPERLVVMLYDGANRFLIQGAAAMRSDSVSACNSRLQRAEAIIDELLSTLDMDQGELAERLQAIYLFCRRTLMEARLERDAKKVDQVAGLLAELRESWASIAGE